MIDFLLFLIGAAFCGMVGLIIFVYALRVVVEILTPVLLFMADVIIWLNRVIRSWLRRGASPPCF